MQGSEKGESQDLASYQQQVPAQSRYNLQNGRGIDQGQIFIATWPGHSTY